MKFTIKVLKQAKKLLTIRILVFFVCKQRLLGVEKAFSKK